MPRDVYHACLCPGSARSQGISSYCIDLIVPEYSGLRTIEIYVTEPNSFALSIWYKNKFGSQNFGY